MVRMQEPEPGRLIISTIYSSVDALADTLRRLERRFGRVENETSGQKCNCREVYHEEMGNDLKIRFFSFEKPVPRSDLPEIKTMCRKIESNFSDHIEDYMFRTVNIDPGIMTRDNLIMAAARDLKQRVYLSDGVFAELTLIYSKGCFNRLPWTHADFCTEEAEDFFRHVRDSLEIVAAI